MPEKFRWNQTMMFLIHRALRRDLGAFAATLRRYANKPPTPQARQALQDRWAYFSRTLHHHHSGEDTLVWPELRKEVPDSSALLDALEGEHAGLEPLITTVQQGMDSLGTSSAVPPGALAADVDALAEHLAAHLEHEERDAVPLLESHISPEFVKEFSSAQRQKMDKADGPMFFPWLTTGATEAESSLVWGLLPSPVRWLVRSRWTKAYEKKTAAAFPTG